MSIHAFMPKTPVKGGFRADWRDLYSPQKMEMPNNKVQTKQRLREEVPHPIFL